ncbi:hypothetical protein FA95DRAFT_1553891 [Auriscalpium vulgare]|uniref:Uncharacterized protein n=1 Tax=Auriscalpium vulgare TaxID=40419 RepID=A0ACB8S6J5_9AGAM|nr:hypothetical protein FA95DRAFT_1553891 [Auriscalpium vulgare]
MDDVEFHHMDEIVPGVWVGDIHSAKDYETLRENNIHSVLTAMRGKVSIHETFMQQQILLDDTYEADVLQHLIPAITFIQAELEKGRGVLVHCHAGTSRSATIAAAYVMYSQNLDVAGALEVIRKVRPSIQPNEGFMAQLEIFHQASYKVSRRDKATRMFYLERAVDDILNGDGTATETDMFARFPRTPTDSAPATPGGPRRRIRCKMCRYELATREHMLDHGQLGPPTPALAFSPATSRRPSMHDVIKRRPSASASAAASRRPSSSLQLPRSRLGSATGLQRPALMSPAEGGSGVLAGLAASLSMSALETEDDDEVDGEKEKAGPDRRRARMPSAGADGRPRRPSAPEFPSGLSQFSMSALESDDEDAVEVEETPRVKTSALVGPAPRTTGSSGKGVLSPLVTSPVPAPMSGGYFPSTTTEIIHEDPTSPAGLPAAGPPPPAPSSATALQSPADLAAQLYANPKLAALRSPIVGMTPMAPRIDKSSISPPILMNPKCSGYFVEPMKWMEFFLEDGQLAGKIICPNKKCGAKLGNYDWAGVCCSCKEWVVPGFCIHRSKVDEIV